MKTELLDVVDILQRVNWTIQKDIDARDISQSVADATPVIYAAAALRARIWWLWCRADNEATMDTPVTAHRLNATRNFAVLKQWYKAEFTTASQFRGRSNKLGCITSTPSCKHHQLRTRA